ncbi:MAG: NifB/NifX family molybdenum-iron cluster-binding protein [Candidatus Zipacnadales bacterium]
MKVAIASTGQTLDAAPDPRFGRCACFLLVDTETDAVTVVENPGAVAGSGAGIAAAQAVANAGAEAVIAGNYGPNAAQALNTGGIATYTAPGKTIVEVLAAFKAGKLKAVSGATVQSHFGLGQSESQ